MKECWRGGIGMNTALTTFFPPELPTILLRLFLAFIAGAVMGLERERFMKGVNRQRGAGFRTYSLVCFGSCLFGLASIYGFSSSGVNNDPGRVAAQVVTGMGFLGAGAIIKLNGNVKGLTTAHAACGSLLRLACCSALECTLRLSSLLFLLTSHWTFIVCSRICFFFQMMRMTLMMMFFRKMNEGIKERIEPGIRMRIVDMRFVSRET